MSNPPGNFAGNDGVFSEFGYCVFLFDAGKVTEIKCCCKEGCRCDRPTPEPPPYEPYYFTAACGP